MMNRNHVLGMGEMIQKYPEAKVYGGKYEDVITSVILHL